MIKLFQKKIEDFTCNKCKKKVRGSGYTNHCPNCLWSRHVDNNPGDRANGCKGMMEPIGIIQKHNNIFIVQKCIQCRKSNHTKTDKQDDKERIIELSKYAVKG